MTTEHTTRDHQTDAQPAQRGFPWPGNRTALVALLAALAAGWYAVRGAGENGWPYWAAAALSAGLVLTIVVGAARHTNQ